MMATRERARQGDLSVGISYEDLVVGSTTEVGRYTFEPDDIKAFAKRYDPQPFHLDEEAGRRRISAASSRAVGIRARCS